MITSRILQAAEALINELTATYPVEADVDEALAVSGVGPRALAHLVKDYAVRFEGNPSGAAMFGFLNGLFSASLDTIIQSGDIAQILEIEDLFTDEPMYEGAELGDLQDMLRVIFGVVTDDDIEPEALVDLLMETTMGVSLATLLGEDTEEESEETQTQWDPIDPEPVQ